MMWVRQTCIGPFLKTRHVFFTFNPFLHADVSLKIFSSLRSHPEMIFNNFVENELNESKGNA